MDTSFQTNSSSVNSASTVVEIPIWLRSHEPPKWVSGIDRKTTCEDVLISVLKQWCPTGKPEDCARTYKVRDPADYTLVEQWRGVERPLSRSSRILKLWLAWGEEREAVRFAVKRLKSSVTPAVSRTRNRVRRRNSNSSTNSKASDTPHPSKRLSLSQRRARGEAVSADRGRKSAQSSEEIQEMMKVIMNQGQMIFQELHKLGVSQGTNGIPLSTTDLPSKVSSDQRMPGSRNGSLMRAARSESNLLSTTLGSSNQLNLSTSQLNHTVEICDTDANMSAEVSMELQKTSDLIQELCRLYSLNEELQTAETKMYLLNSNYDQMKQSLPQKAPTNPDTEASLGQELRDLQESNNRVSADIQKNQSLLTSMDSAFKAKKEAVKRLEYDFNLIEKEGKKLAREFDKVMQIQIPDIDSSTLEEPSRLLEDSEVIYTELKELQRNSVARQALDEDTSAEGVDQGTVLDESVVSGAGVEHASSSGVSSGSESSSSDKVDKGNKISKVLVVSDYSAVKSVVKLKEKPAFELKQSETITDKPGKASEEEAGSDTGLSSLHSSGEDEENSHSELTRTTNLVDIISAASGDFGTLV